MVSLFDNKKNSAVRYVMPDSFAKIIGKHSYNRNCKNYKNIHVTYSFDGSSQREEELVNFCDNNLYASAIEGGSNRGSFFIIDWYDPALFGLVNQHWTESRIYVDSKLFIVEKFSLEEEEKLTAIEVKFE